jgi:hypothetical protein
MVGVGWVTLAACPGETVSGLVACCLALRGKTIMATTTAAAKSRVPIMKTGRTRRASTFPLTFGFSFKIIL